MEKRPVKSKEEVKIYNDQVNRIRQQLNQLINDYNSMNYTTNEMKVFNKALLERDIRLLQDVEYNLLKRINEYLETIGENPIK
jgi:hypothetical protein